MSSESVSSIKIETRYFETILKLSRSLSPSQNEQAIKFSIQSSLDWLILHELQHAELGHFDLLDGRPSLHLVSRSQRTLTPLDGLPEELWDMVEPCLELQADHDALELMLEDYSEADWDDIRMEAASISAAMVLIEREDTRNNIRHSTHPKAATRIFQLLGHMSEMWSHPAHARARLKGEDRVEANELPSDEEVQTFSRQVILPAFWNAVALAEAAEAKSIIADLGASENFFADIRYAKLGQWDRMKTVGAKEWASLKQTNELLLPLLKVASQ